MPLRSHRQNHATFPVLRNLLTGTPTSELRGRCRQQGFTLIELVLTLVLVGIMASSTIVGISNLVTGFMLSRDAAALTTKGQLALLRLSREFRVITSVANASATSIEFTALHGSGVTKTYTVAKSGSAITMTEAGNSDILVDGVDSLALAYYDTYDGAAQTSWSSTRRVIQLAIGLSGPEGSAFTFTTRVTPRNL